MVDCQQYLNLTIHSHELLIPNSSLVLLSYTWEVTVTMVIHLSLFSDANKSVFDWCKEGNVKKLDFLLTREGNVNTNDDQVSQWL